ncbi:MAG: 16S rRNA (guanine(527)-N(7))-methyltransferase RsmG [Synergistales bacterium]|nr:16S rRNA (guanine(527)-N(7))-methyltransferase RsmG [Synergistales bacterium]
MRFLDRKGAMRRTREAFPRLEDYGRELLRRNQRCRMVGPRAFWPLFREHILDCAALLPLLPGVGRLCDIGTGGGLPGLVWALLQPELEVTLLEKGAKKAGALSSLVAALEVDNAVVVCSRAEELAGEGGERFDLVTGRAVAHTGILAEYAAPLLVPCGTLLVMKGPGYRAELEELEGGWERLGLSPGDVFLYTNFGRELYALLFHKTAEPLVRLPRRPGMAEKRKWWR